MTDSTASADWGRLSAATAPSDLIAAHVTDLVALPVDDQPWLTGLTVPEGWQAAESPDRRLRIATYGPRPDGGWDGCETINVYGFTGIPHPDVLIDNVDRALRDLDAVGIFTHAPSTPRRPGLAAALSKGHLTIGGRQVWARFSTYLAGSDEPDQGRLVQHILYIDAHRLVELAGTVRELTDAVPAAFWNSTEE